MNPAVRAAICFAKTFTLGGVSTLLMKAIQRNATLGYRALDEWRARSVHVPPPVALPRTAQLFTLY